MLPGCAHSARLGQLLGFQQPEYLEGDMQWEERERVTTARGAEMMKPSTVRGGRGQLRGNVMQLHTTQLGKQGSHHSCQMRFRARCRPLPQQSQSLPKLSRRHSSAVWFTSNLILFVSAGSFFDPVMGGQGTIGAASRSQIHTFLHLSSCIYI